MIIICTFIWYIPIVHADESNLVKLASDDSTCYSDCESAGLENSELESCQASCDENSETDSSNTLVSDDTESNANTGDMDVIVISAVAVVSALCIGVMSKKVLDL
jgi:hypothetical protein